MWQTTYWQTTYWPTDYWPDLTDELVPCFYPDPQYVAAGVQYGAGGTQYTGTLVVPVVVGEGLSVTITDDAITATVED